MDFQGAQGRFPRIQPTCDNNSPGLEIFFVDIVKKPMIPILRFSISIVIDLLNLSRDVLTLAATNGKFAPGADGINKF